MEIMCTWQSDRPATHKSVNMYWLNNKKNRELGPQRGCLMMLHGKYNVVQVSPQ